MAHKTVHVYLNNGKTSTHSNVIECLVCGRVVQITTEPSDTMRETFIIPLKQIHGLVQLEESV